MKLQAPFIQLPALFDADVLSREIVALERAAWEPCSDGSSLLRLVSAGGKPDAETLSGPMKPTPALRQLSYLPQVLESLGASWGQVFLQRLAVGRQCAAQVELEYYARERLRLHVPLRTQGDVLFECGDEVVHLGAGTAWAIDTWRPHRFAGPGNADCVHLVADTVGGERLWDLLVRGRAPGRKDKFAWQPATLAPVEDHVVSLVLETVNAPAVMSPWELREHLMFILGEAVNDPRLPGLQQVLLRFARQWHALWAVHGAARTGVSQYRALLAATVQACEQAGAEQMVLRNGIGLWPALRAQVLQVALAAGAKPVRKAAVAKKVAAKKAPTRKAKAEVPATPAPAKRVTPPTIALHQPVFIVGAPRSGCRLLWSTLTQSPDLVTSGKANVRVIEGIQQLSPAQRATFDNRLLGEDAGGDVAGRVRQRYARDLRDRSGRPATGALARLLDEGSKLALRVAFLAQVFPDARFIYLHRDPREVVGSMINGWESGRFVTYPALPAWEGAPWSFALTPGWQALSGQPLDEVVAAQWSASVRCMLDDLDQLPAERWIGVDFDRLLADPSGEVARLCAFAGLAWDHELGEVLPRLEPAAAPMLVEAGRQRAAALLPAHAALIQRALEASLHG